MQTVCCRSVIKTVEVVVGILEDGDAQWVKEHVMHRSGIFKVRQVIFSPVRTEVLLDMCQQLRLYLCDFR